MAEIDDLQIRLLRARLAEATEANAAPVIDPDTMTEQERARLPVPSVKREARDVVSNVRQAGRDVGEAAAEFISRGGQMLARGVEAVVPSGTPASRWAENQRQLSERASQRRKERFEKERVGTGIGEFGREIVGTLPALAIPGMGATLLARLATGAVQGAMAGAFGPPPTGGNYLPQMATGAGIGAAVPLAAGAAARVVSPRASTDKGVQTLLKEGVKLTPGALTGGFGKWAENVTASTPLMGAMQRQAQRYSAETLNRATANRSLNEIGQELPKSVDVGRDAVQYVQHAVDQAYSKALAPLSAKVDPQFASKVNLIRAGLRPGLQTKFDETLADHVGDWAVGKTWTGETLSSAQSELRVIGQANIREPLQGNQKLGKALLNVRAAMDDMIERQNPNKLGPLLAARRAYANLSILNRAAAMRGGTEGLVSPSQLAAAVAGNKATASTKTTAAGRSLMQDLSDPANARMRSSVPNSGTVDRAMAMGLLFGGPGAASMIHPGLALGMGAGMGMYTRPGMAAMNTILARRPIGAPGLAGFMRGASPALIPPLVAGNPWRE